MRPKLFQIFRVNWFEQIQHTNQVLLQLSLNICLLAIWKVFKYHHQISPLTLTLSWRRPLSCRNPSIDLLCKCHDKLRTFTHKLIHRFTISVLDLIFNENFDRTEKLWVKQNEKRRCWAIYHCIHLKFWMILKL